MAKNTLKILTGMRQSGQSTRLIRRVAKIHRGHAVLAFARNTNMVEELIKKQRVFGVISTTHAASDSFPQIADWLERCGHDLMKQLIVVVDDVTSKQLEQLMHYSARGVQVICSYSHDLSV